jgi:hypothetical protein
VRAAAALLLCAAGCTEKLESLELPRLDLPGVELPKAGAPDADAKAGAPDAKASAAPDEPRAAAPRAAAAEAPLECDDLPSADQERRAKLPPQTPLGKAVPADPSSAPPYTVLPGVTLPARVAAKLEQIDRAYARRTREHLVITSGTRDANRQARAMYTKLKLGDDLLAIYRNKAAVQEIKRAYRAASGKPPEKVVTAMEAVIQDQIDRGIFISAHLRQGAVDVRNRTMSRKEKRAFLESVAEVGGVRVLEETRPAHYHLQID